MTNDDRITVAEDYCIACRGNCTNDDPSDFGHLCVEFESLAGAWMDRGVSPAAIWAFLGSMLVDISQQNDMTEDEAIEAIQHAWRVRAQHDAEET